MPSNRTYTYMDLYNTVNVGGVQENEPSRNDGLFMSLYVWQILGNNQHTSYTDKQILSARWQTCPTLLQIVTFLAAFRF